MAYDPKRSRPSVAVEADQPAAVEELVALPDAGPTVTAEPAAGAPADESSVEPLVPTPDASRSDVEVDDPGPGSPVGGDEVSGPSPETSVDEPVGPDVVSTSPSPFEPAGPPDQRVLKAVAIAVTTAGALALMVAWRRRAR